MLCSLFVYVEVLMIFGDFFFLLGRGGGEGTQVEGFPGQVG
jgi:hypothetical protein